MKLRIHHRSTYQYNSPVEFGVHKVRLFPRLHPFLTVSQYDLQTEPNSRIRWVQDDQGNHVAACDFGRKTASCSVFTLSFDVTAPAFNPFDFILAPHATGYPFQYSAAELTSLAPYLDESAFSHAPFQCDRGKVIDWFYLNHQNPLKHDNLVSYLLEMVELIRGKIAYSRREEEGIQTPEATISLGSGSCRDMTVLFIQLCREAGIATRFTSGYLYEPPAEGEPAAESNPQCLTAAGAMHAWAEVYLPGAGWRGFCPTNGILANEHFIPTAVSIYPEQTTPIDGAYFSKIPVTSTLDVQLEISPLTAPTQRG